MFARRFTIVCLMTVVFGMVFANIVALAGRERTWNKNRVVACDVTNGIACGRQRF